MIIHQNICEHIQAEALARISYTVQKRQPVFRVFEDMLPSVAS